MLRKLAGQTAVYGISSIVARMLNFLLVPYLTRIMGKEAYGELTDLYALIPFMLVVLTMGMETGYFRFAAKAETPLQKKNVFATTWGAVSYLAIAFMSLVLLFNDSIASAMRYDNHPSFVWIVGLIIALDVITAIPFAKLRQEGRPGRFVKIRLASVIVNVLFCLFFYSVLPKFAEAGILTSIYDPNFGAGYVIIANLIASAVALVMILPSCRGVVPKIDIKLFKTILIYSLPLLISGIAGTANEFIDRQMIKYLLPEQIAKGELGIYGAVVKIGVVMLLFTQMYRLAAEPFFLSNFKKEDFQKINAEALKYFVIVSVFIFLGITLFVDVFALLIGRDFREGIYILPVVLVANIFSGIVLNLSFWYKQTGKTKFAIMVTGTGLVITMIMGFILVPRMGYYGAAWARLLCEIVMVALSYYLCRKYYPIPYDLKRIGSYFLVGVAIYGISLLSEQLPVVIKYLVNFVLVASFFFYAVWREKIDIAGLVKSILKRK